MPERIKIICTLCDEFFFHDDFDENNANAVCKCKNIQMKIEEKENSRYKHYVCAAFKDVRPEIEIIKVDKHD